MKKEKIFDKVEKESIVWRDKLSIKIFLSILFLTFIILLSILFFISNMLWRILSLIFIVFMLVGLLDISRRKTVSVTKEGVYMNNVKFVNNRIKMKQRNVLISWSLIKEIKIVNRISRGGYFSLLRPLLVIKTKQNKLFRDILYDPKGFSQALKRISKSSLMSKDSKYLNKEYIKNETNV